MVRSCVGSVAWRCFPPVPVQSPPARCWFFQRSLFGSSLSTGVRSRTGRPVRARRRCEKLRNDRPDQTSWVRCLNLGRALVPAASIRNSHAVRSIVRRHSNRSMGSPKLHDFPASWSRSAVAVRAWSPKVGTGFRKKIMLKQQTRYMIRFELGWIMVKVLATRPATGDCAAKGPMAMTQSETIPMVVNRCRADFRLGRRRALRMADRERCPCAGATTSRTALGLADSVRNCDRPRLCTVARSQHAIVTLRCRDARQRRRSGIGCFLSGEILPAAERVATAARSGSRMSDAGSPGPMASRRTRMASSA